MLHKEYFTPVSLLTIIEYFVKSRLSYGLCCFLDHNSEMKKLDNLLLRHIKVIFRLPSNTSHNRLQLTLGEPDLSSRLAVRLLKNWHKYKEHFGEYPEKFRNCLKVYFTDEEIDSMDVNFNYGLVKCRIVEQNLKDKAKDYFNFEYRIDHREILKDYFFTYPDRRDYLVINYITNTTKCPNETLFPMCECGEVNSIEHAPNDCKLRLIDRNEILKELNRIYMCNKIPAKVGLYVYLHFSFFGLNFEKLTIKDRRRTVEIIKSTIS